MRQLNSSKQGLAFNEAFKRWKDHGPNQLVEYYRPPVFFRFLSQFKELINLLLLVTSFVTFFILGDRRAGLILFVLAIANGLIGFMQEYRAEQLMADLEELAVSDASVYRDGKILEVDATELVPGDVVHIQEGDSVPADLRLIEETELATNDFALTGESEPVRKFTRAIGADVALAERNNLVFMGTTVAIGNAYGVVVGTGMQTELGRIADLSQEVEEDRSPLQKELGFVARRITKIALALGLVLLLIAIRADMEYKEAMLFAIGLAVSAIPQGLPAEINAALAQAADKLVHAKALVKKLSAVESLGATNVILTDKTGTLTRGEMTVEQLFIGKNEYRATGTGYVASGYVATARGRRLPDSELKELELLFMAGAFASNARVCPPDESHASWY
ncbi:MAG: HAD-IC family P-type ATPase, partial [Acidobacteriota bacterium]